MLYIIARIDDDDDVVSADLAADATMTVVVVSNDEFIVRKVSSFCRCWMEREIAVFVDIILGFGVVKDPPFVLGVEV